MGVRFVADTATEQAATCVSDLAGMDIEIKPPELHTAHLAARACIVARGLRPACIIHDAIRFDSADINQRNPGCKKPGTRSCDPALASTLADRVARSGGGR